MNPAIANIIIGVAPELMQFIRGFFTATGTLPTDEQLINNFHANADRVTAVSDAWLKAHPEQNK